MKQIISILICLALIPGFFMTDALATQIRNNFESAASSVTEVMDGDAEGEYVADELIVKFKDTASDTQKQKVNKDKKAVRTGYVEQVEVYEVKLTDENQSADDMLKEYESESSVEYAEKNYIMTPLYIPNDEYYTRMANVSKVINTPGGWDVIRDNADIISGAGIIVAVVDSGVVQHKDMATLIKGFSSVNDLSPNTDNNGHGTKMAGIIGSIGDNYIGTAGVN